MRLIDADALIIKPDFILYDVCGTPVIRCEDLARIINDMPTIEQQKGKWIKDQKRFGDDAYHCDQCGAVLEKDDIEWRNNYYCYHCGSCMKGN